MAEPRTDRELLRLWRDGDEPAGAELFERHFASIYRFFRAKVGEEADELTQRTFLGAVESKERIWEDATFRAYLFGIARNQLLKHLGRHYRDRDHAALSMQSIHDLQPSPSREVAADEGIERTLQAMRKLSIDAQVALELHYWEELPIAEVAKVLGAPEGTIKSRIHRARAQLGRELEALGAAPVTEASLAAQATALSEALRTLALEKKGC